MKIISIALKDLQIISKDKKALARITLFPIILIIVLGLSLSSAFNSTEPTIKNFKIGIVDQDLGEGAKQFKEYLETESIKNIITSVEMDEQDAIAKVNKGDIAAYILLPKDYSTAILEGKPAILELYEDPGSEVKGKIVESILKGYTNTTSTVKSVVDATSTIFETYKIDPHTILPEVMTVMDIEKTVDNQVNGRRILEAIQYYSAGMLVMYILFVGMLGTTSIIEEREQKTLMRLMGTTTNNRTIISGKLLGLFLLGLIDVFVLILFTCVAFKVNWGDSILGLILLSCAMVFAASGFAMFLASLFKTSKAVHAANPVLIMLMAFLGGSMYPLYAMPETMQNFSKITLNNWALRGYMDLMLGNGISSIGTSLIVLTVMGAVFLIAGISRLKLV